jgi:hypothetical protein
MRRLIFFIVLTGLGLTTANGTPIPEPTKADFLRATVRTCMVKQRQSTLTRYLTDAQVNEYCNCSGARVLQFINLEDLERMMQTRSNVPLLPIIEAAGDYCTDMLAKK